MVYVLRYVENYFGDVAVKRMELATIITAWRYASAVYTVVVCLSVRPAKWLNVGSHKQRHTTAQGH